MTDSRHAPDVDYLTRDYEGFQKLLVSLLDRARTKWTERAAADAGIMLVEILANQLDHLAYAGDRAAEEAFLPTARQRKNARRHAALGDHRLDRGNVTSGFQHVRLKPGGSRELPAGTRLGQPLAYGDDPAQRLVFETTAAARIDAQLDQLALGRSVAAGETWLHLRATDGSKRNLRTIGLGPGARLCLVDRDRGTGEMITLRRVQGDAVELTDPLGDSYLASAAQVLGNMVAMRRGQTSEWQLAARTGAARGDVPATEFFAQRIAVVRRLRDEVEAAREAWIGDRWLAGWWELACAEVSGVVRELRASAGVVSDDQAKTLDERLERAAQLLRDVLRKSGFALPEALAPNPRVSIRSQGIALPGDLPDLWSDDAETLRVRVDVAGRGTRWIEQDDFLRSGPEDPHYVVEIDDRGLATLRFGDGVNGALLPPDGSVMVQRVTGELFAGDLGAGALQVMLSNAADDLELTENPLPTAGGRPPEPLGDELVRRVRLDLARRAIPVTADDHRTVLLENFPDIAEVSVAVVERHGILARVIGRRVDAVIRPRPGKDPARVLAKARALLRAARLAGSDVWVRLYEPLFVSIALVVEVHPEMTAADVRVRLRRELLQSFGGGASSELGRARTRAEIHATVESVPGVIYSQVIGFDRASRPIAELAAQETIQPGRDQVVRCLGLPDNPLCGDITMWAARRYRLQLELGYPDPDERPDPAVLTAMVMELLSGRDARPVRDRWPAVTPARIDELLARMRSYRDSHRLVVRALMIGERSVDQVTLGDGELPILDGVEFRDQPFKPHFRLALELRAGAGADASLVARLERRVVALLSGPRSAPVTERWSELTLRLVDTALARELGPAVPLSATAMRVGTRSVDRIALEPRDVPVLDAVTITLPGQGP